MLFLVSNLLVIVKSERIYLNIKVIFTLIKTNLFTIYLVILFYITINKISVKIDIVLKLICCFSIVYVYSFLIDYILSHLFIFEKFNIKLSLL